MKAIFGARPWLVPSHLIPLGQVLGDSGPEALAGTGEADTITANAGDDTVWGKAGMDVILLGDGNDVYGSTAMFGGTAVDEFGADSVDGGAGNDLILDWRGENTLAGGQGSDTLDGTTTLQRDALADVLVGGGGRDTLVGDNGDTLTGGTGASDVFTLLPGGKPVVLTDAQSQAQAGFNADRIVLLLPDNTNVDLTFEFRFGAAPNPSDSALMMGNATAAILLGEAGQFPSVEIVTTTQRMPGWGGDLGDVLTGTGGDDFLFGGNGNDTLNGNAGNDFTNDGWGDDLVQLGNGDDYLLGADHVAALSDNDDIRGGAGNDWLQTAMGADTVQGGDGNDWIDVGDLAGQSGPEADSVQGGAGNDTILADAGDTVAGNAGADMFNIFGLGPVVIKDFTPGEDRAILAAAAGSDVIASQSGHDTLIRVDGTLVLTLTGVDAGDITLMNGMIL